jgi:hypothetical protein
MRTTAGFDRLSTEEELHQVLAVLEEFSRNGWTVPGSDSSDSLECASSADAALVELVEEDETPDAESLAQLIAKRPELKN